MANLWTLKFGKDAKLPVLVRSGTNVGANMSFVKNRVYKGLSGHLILLMLIMNFLGLKVLNLLERMYLNLE